MKRVHLNEIADIEVLFSLKEQIKQRIVEPQIHWEKRIELYKQVQEINQRIQQLGHLSK